MTLRSYSHRLALSKCIFLKMHNAYNQVKEDFTLLFDSNEDEIRQILIIDHEDELRKVVRELRETNITSLMESQMTGISHRLIQSRRHYS